MFGGFAGKGGRQKRRRHIKLAEIGGRAGAAKGGMETTPRGRVGSVHPVGSRKDDTKTKRQPTKRHTFRHRRTHKETVISGGRRTQRTRRPGRKVHHRGAQETVWQAKGTKKGAAPEGKGGRARQREEPVRAMQKPHNRKERDSPGRRRGQKQQTRGKHSRRRGEQGI